MKPLSIPAAMQVRTLRPGRPARSTGQCTGIRLQAPVCRHPFAGTRLQASGTAQPAKDEYRTEDMAP